MKLYGKDLVCEVLEKTARQNRLSHAVLFSGKSGVGKKTLARYTAQLILCENNACGKCPCCKTIENDAHPDVIFVKKACAGKYQADALGEVLKSAVVLPNNGNYKVYIFEECDTMLPVHFNALLKLIEEPPAHVRFIFTCVNTALVPETILSRVTEYEIPDPTVEDCRQFLLDGGADAKKAEETAEMFSGNFGESVNYLLGGETKIIDSAKKIALAISQRNAYSAYAELSLQSAKSDFYRIFDYLANVFRDALAIKFGQPAEYSDKQSAKKIAENFTEEEILNMSNAAFEISSNEVYNLNTALGASYFISGIL